MTLGHLYGASDPPLSFPPMSELVAGIRRARTSDASALSAIHDAAWAEAYRGIIPAIALERAIARRGPRWWLSAVRRGRPLAVFELGDRVVGYASYGRCRDGRLPAQGEIDELYFTPECQGLGFGTRLFRAVRNDLSDQGAKRVVVWALAENERACAFYERMGGAVMAETQDRFGGVKLRKVGFLFA